MADCAYDGCLAWSEDPPNDGWGITPAPGRWVCPAHLDWWPDCAVPWCTAKCCQALLSPLCYPHTPKSLLTHLIARVSMRWARWWHWRGR